MHETGVLDPPFDKQPCCPSSSGHAEGQALFYQESAEPTLRRFPLQSLVCSDQMLDKI